MRVKTALLAVESQHLRQNRRRRNGDSPVSSVPPVHPAECPYGDVTRRRRRGRIKIAPINVNQMPKVENTYLGRDNALRSTQPPENDLKRCFGDVRRRRRRSRIKIGPVKVKIKRISDKPAREDEKTYRGHARTAQPLGNPPERRYGVHRPRRQRARIKTEPTNVNQTRNGGNAYLQRGNTIQSIRRPKKDKRRLDGLTFESRMPGEPWRDDGDHG